ncbi:hypothetical protein [Phenylobacterium conjunctum]|uniref:hypothetical protein n=1 Tax=Phenylobacterium conjunctum TaxID=1298959 RepID=UPI003672B579
MGDLTLKQVRAWERRASTLADKAAALLSDMIAAVGVEHEELGENFTSQVDDVLASAENLTNYLHGVGNRIKNTRRSKDADQ